MGQYVGGVTLIRTAGAPAKLGVDAAVRLRSAQRRHARPVAFAKSGAAGGLKVLGKSTTRPRHPKAADPSDPLAPARAKEITTLWRLGARVEVGR